MAFSPDGRRIVSGSRDSTVKVWDAATGQEMLTLKGIQSLGSWRGLQPGRPADRIWSADKTVKVWDAATGQEMLALEGTRKLG